MRSLLFVALGSMLAAAPALSKSLRAAEMQTSAVVLDEADSPHSCGIKTAIRAESDTPTDLQTTIELQLIVSLTEDGQGVAGQMGLRVARFDLHEGQMRFVGAPSIVKASLSNADRRFVAELGEEARQGQDGYLAAFIDTTIVNALMLPSSEIGRMRELRFEDALSTRGEESVEFALAVGPTEARTYFACMDAMIRRGKAMRP
ncbi:MAG: hypothetical protein O9256_00775 [Rhizobiaceae bacterium]|nr:hypothetical protein [Rhizobiaceae bacterium]